MNKWFDCKNKMPFSEYGEGKSVLTVDAFGTMCIAYFDGGNWCWPTGECIETRKHPITHWMPLPEPPKEE